MHTHPRTHTHMHKRIISSYKHPNVLGRVCVWVGYGISIQYTDPRYYLCIMVIFGNLVPSRSGHTARRPAAAQWFILPTIFGNISVYNTCGGCIMYLLYMTDLDVMSKTVNTFQYYPSNLIWKLLYYIHWYTWQVVHFVYISHCYSGLVIFYFIFCRKW